LRREVDGACIAFGGALLSSLPVFGGWGEEGEREKKA